MSIGILTNPSSSKICQPKRLALFEHRAATMISRTSGISKKWRGRRFRALFGVSSNLCAIVWNMIEEDLSQNAQPIHFLWSLLFLKVYATEHVNAMITGVCEKTFRKWVLYFITIVADLQIIDLDARRTCKAFGLCKVSVDGTDFRIYELTSFSSKWFSHKFKGPGLRYEVAIAIETGNIVWTHGPFPCGSYSDLTIFRAALKDALDPGENLIADGGYQDERCRNPNANVKYRRFDAVCGSSSARNCQ